MAGISGPAPAQMLPKQTQTKSKAPESNLHGGRLQIVQKNINKKGMNLLEDKTHETHHRWKHTTEMPFSSYYWDKWKINSIPLSASDPRQQAIARTTPP